MAGVWDTKLRASVQGPGMSDEERRDRARATAAAATASKPAPISRPQITAPSSTPAPPRTQPYSGASSSPSGGTTTIINQAPAAPAAPPRPVPTMNLEDYIKTNFLYKSQQDENARLDEDFEGETLRGRQQVLRDQGVRNQRLTSQLNELGTANAEDLAGRGLLRSGITFQNQDKINAEGVDRRYDIDRLLPDFDTKRQQAKAAQAAANRNALNERIKAITDTYNQTYYGVSV